MIKIEKKPQKIYIKDYNVLIVEDLWRDDYQILLIILLMEFIKLIANMDMIMKHEKHMELNKEIFSAALNKQALKMIW